MVNPERKARGRASLRDFGLEYFPRRFKKAIAGPHKAGIAGMESATDNGECQAVAMPRGTGKTTWAEVAVLRAVLYGLRKFVVLVQATEKLAVLSLKKLQRELESNDRLLEDFPEVCFPIRALERIHNRAKGQTLDGKPTRIEWTADGVSLPCVDGSAAAGAQIRVYGITGAIRGLSVMGPDGEVFRPDLAIVDDAQTRGSARSPIETDERERIVCDDVLGLAGPDSTIAAVMLCTVIYPFDLSDRFLSPDKHPEWQGIRTRMLEAWPTNMDLWDQYAEVLRDSFRTGDKGKRATEFYRQHQAEMDKGARVSWPERVKPGELSGIQSAMNLWITNPRGFKAEYQNEPDKDHGSNETKELFPDAIAGRLNGLPRYEVPREAVRVTAMIDVGRWIHWYLIAAWDPTFGGSVIDYGTWPRQTRPLFAANDPRPNLGTLYPGMTEDAQVYAGLSDLTADILGRSYYRETSGEELRIERCLIDSGWNTSTVYQFCRQNANAAVIYPSKGIARTTTSRGVSEWQIRPGEQAGWHWRLTVGESKARMVQFDPDAWKSFLYSRLITDLGGRGALTLYGKKAATHEMLALHCSAETADPVTVRGTTFDKWVVKVDHPDNHFLDTLVGAAVAASVQGLQWSATGEVKTTPQRKQVRWSEVAAQRKQEKQDAMRAKGVY